MLYTMLCNHQEYSGDRAVRKIKTSWPNNYEPRAEYFAHHCTTERLKSEEHTHGRRNGFKSGTTEGVEHEPPETANRNAEGVDEFSPHQQGGLREIFLEIYV